MVILNDEVIYSNQYRPDYNLLPVVQSMSYMSNESSLRIIYLIYSAIGKLKKANTNLEIPITSDLISYLGISQSNDYWKDLEDALNAISKCPIIRVIRDENGKHRWMSTPWFSSYTLSDKYKRLRIDINSHVVPYIPLVSSFSKVRPISCVKLSRGFPTWLYIVLTNASYYGDYWVIDVEDFRHVSGMNDRESHSTEDRRIKSISSHILGLVPSPEFKEEAKLARKEKRPIRFTPCRFSTSDGNMSVVRSKSELLVNSCNVKIKNITKYLAFSFRKEDDNGISYGDSFEYMKYLTFEEELINSTLDISTIRIK